MGAAALTTSLALTRQSVAKTAKEVDRSYVVAEAGLNVALYELQDGFDFGADGIGNVSGDLGEGSHVTTIDPPFLGLGEYTLRSVGTVGGIERGLEAVVVSELEAITGLFGLEGVEVGGSSMVDSYHSSIGSYTSQAAANGSRFAEENAQVGSNADISIPGSASIHGDAIPGVKGSVYGSGSSVTGSTAPALFPRTFTPYVYNPPIPSSGPLKKGGTLSSGQYRFDSVDLSGGNTLTLTGDVEIYVDRDFQIRGTGEIFVSAGANVTFHHGSGDWDIGGNGMVNEAELPQAIEVFSATTDTVRVGGTGEFFGLMYAIGAEAEATGGGGYFGTLVAESVLVWGSGGFHHDADTAPNIGPERIVIQMIRPYQP